MIVFNVEASIDPVVFPSKAFNDVAEMVVSVKVTDSFPNPVIPVESIAVVTSATDPVNEVTVDASTLQVVFVSTVLSVVAATVVSLKVTASSPKPEIVPAVLAA